MNFRECRQKMKAQTDPLLLPRGYKGKAAGDGVEYIKATSFGKNIFVYSLGGAADIFRTSGSIRVEVTAVQKVAREIESTLADSNFSIPSTISFLYGDFIGELNHSFRIEKDEDIQKWYSAMERYLTDFGFSVFEKYTTLESLDTLFNTNLADPDILILKSERVRFQQGIIIARLVNNPRTDWLIAQYRQMIKNPLFKEIYEPYAKFISEHTHEEIVAIANSEESPPLS